MNFKVKKVIICIFLIFIIISWFISEIGSCNNKLNKVTSSKVDISKIVSLKDLNFIPKFKSKDLNGKEISNKIFKENKITLVNLWGTWKDSSVTELSKIQEIYNQMKDNGVNVIGIIEDGTKNEKSIREIIKKNNINFRNIIPNEKFYNSFVTLFLTYPYSLIVDSNGKILEFINDNREKNEYINLIEKSLKK